MESRSPQSASAAGTVGLPPLRRRQLIVQDSLMFLSLLAVTVVMSGLTAFLFRSFEAHREDLAVHWAQQGLASLQQGKSADAVMALRTSLTYAPDDRANQVALAQALADSGHGNEAENYYLNLWQAQPGDGQINRQLARLERSRGKAPEAINYYRAALYGTWPGDAVQRRRDVRLELSSYLIDRGEKEAARAELTIAAGNNPDSATQLQIGEMLEAAADPKDAMGAYRNAFADAKLKPEAEARLGELCYRMGDYRCAESALSTAVTDHRWTGEQTARMSGMRDDATLLQGLAYSHDVPAGERAARLLNDAGLAQDRLKACTTGTIAVPLATLQKDWKTLDTAKNRIALRHDDDVQDAYGSLIYETEQTAADSCGAPSGKDALLLYLHDHPLTHFGEGR